MFEYKAARQLFEPNRNKVTREWRRLHDEELDDLYSSSNIFLVIKSRRIRWVDMIDLWVREEMYVHIRSSGWEI